jgi:hypothetical protein
VVGGTLAARTMIINIVAKTHRVLFPGWVQKRIGRHYYRTKSTRGTAPLYFLQLRVSMVVMGFLVHSRGHLNPSAPKPGAPGTPGRATWFLVVPMGSSRL